MKLRNMALVLLAAAGLACEGSGTGPEPAVARPRFVTAAADSAELEAGIDAVPEEEAIFLQWRREAALAGFELFRRREGEKEFVRLAALTAADSSYLDRTPAGVRCFYYLRGVDEEGRLSAPSDTADYLLLPKATALMITAGDTLIFSWAMTGMRPAAYLIRLEEEESGTVVWICSMEPDFATTRESARWNQNRRARQETLYRGVKYRWRIDCVGASPHSGSESAWQRFTLM